jgi:hypothetical protein
LDNIEDESGPSMRDHVLAILRKVMNWHASNSDGFNSPIRPGMAVLKPAERARERVLSDDELRVCLEGRWQLSRSLWGER